jgi:sensor histidine kinase YesM
MQRYVDDKRFAARISNYFDRRPQLKKSLLHVEIWTLVFLFFYIGEIRLSHSFAMWDSLMVVVSQVIIFYSNIYFKKQVQFSGEHYRTKSIALIIMLSAVDLLVEYSAQIRRHYGVSGNVEDWYTLFSVVLFVYFNTSAYLASEFLLYRQESHEHQMLIEKLKKEKTESQLELLQARINPHFLFNSLNTIYAMSYLEDPNTPEKIMRLSDLLRYVLYECNDDEILLEKEIDYLKSYIEFNRISDDEIRDITFVETTGFGQAKIAPMILLSFVENACKHSRILFEKDGFIHISAGMRDNVFDFSIINSISKSAGINNATPYSGIGLENIRKRLNFLYRGNYLLYTTKDDDKYNVEFTVNLKNYERK